MYILYGGDFTRATLVQWVLEEGKIEYELRKIDIYKGEHRSAEFLATNPAGFVPVLITPEGETLYEVAALMVYLADRHGLTDLAPAVTDPRRGLFLSTVFNIAGDIQSDEALLLSAAVLTKKRGRHRNPGPRKIARPQPLERHGYSTGKKGAIRLRNPLLSCRFLFELLGRVPRQRRRMPAVSVDCQAVRLGSISSERNPLSRRDREDGRGLCRDDEEASRRRHRLADPDSLCWPFAIRCDLSAVGSP